MPTDVIRQHELRLAYKVVAKSAKLLHKFHLSALESTAEIQTLQRPLRAVCSL